MKRWIGIAAALLFACAVPATSRAAEIGHYVPGLVNIRDLYVPDPGFYGVV